MNERKLITRILTAILVMMLLTACGAKPAPTVPATEPDANLVNPISEVTADEMVQKTGVALDAPADADSVHYFVIDSQPAIAQVTFSLSGTEYTYRASMAQLDALALSGVYLGSPTESAAQVSYNEGKLLTEGNTAVLYWEDVVPGICYTLSCADCKEPAVMTEIAEQIFVPAQGDSDAD